MAVLPETCVVKFTRFDGDAVRTSDNLWGTVAAAKTDMAEYRGARVKTDATMRRSFNCVPPMEMTAEQYAWDFVTHPNLNSSAAAGVRTNTDMQVATALLPNFDTTEAAGTSGKGRYFYNSVDGNGYESINPNYNVPHVQPKGARALTAGHFAHWVRGTAMRVVENAAFKSQSGAGIMDEHDFLSMYAFEELMGHQGKRSFYLDTLYAESREDLIRNSLKVQDVYVRLPFFFTLSHQCSLENVSALDETFTIDIQYASLSRLIVRSSTAVRVDAAEPLETTAFETHVPTSARQGAHGASEVNPHSNSPHNMQPKGPLLGDNNKLLINGHILIGAVYMNDAMHKTSVQEFGKAYDVHYDEKNLSAEKVAEAIADYVNMDTAERKKKESQMRIQEALMMVVGDPTSEAERRTNDTRFLNAANQKKEKRYGGKSLHNFEGVISKDERVKPYIQTLHAQESLKGKILAGSVKIKVIGTHPVIELIVGIQHDRNALCNAWTNMSAVVEQSWYTPDYTEGKNAVGKGVTSGPHGYTFDSDSPLAVNSRIRKGPLHSIEVNANGEIVRMPKASATQYSSVMPHMSHSGTPNISKNAYWYSIPIAINPEACHSWSGSLNQGRLDDISLDLVISPLLAESSQDLKVHVIARTWNVQSYMQHEKASVEGASGYIRTCGAKYNNNMQIEIS